ncbi:unnamed protein product [Caenorhabditis brenneri]
MSAIFLFPQFWSGHNCMVLWTGDIEYIAGLSWSDPREYSADDEEENDSDSTYPYEYLYEVSDEDSTDSEDDCSDEDSPTEITIRWVYNFLDHSKKNFIQIFFALKSTPIIAIKWAVERNVLRERETGGEESKNENDAELSEKSDSSEDEADSVGLTEAECKVCYQQFSTKLKKRIPRMLKECGHSLCGGCANNLLSLNKLSINCPFCQKTTFVDGSANKLPKNFTVIGMLEELKKSSKALSK